MSSESPPQPDAWQQNAIFTKLLQAPAAKAALTTLEQCLKSIFNSHAFYSLDTGMLTVKLSTLTSILTDANLLPPLTSHDFKLGLHLAVTPTLSQAASPSKNQPLHFDSFVNAVAFCVYSYPPHPNPSQTSEKRTQDYPIGLELSLNTAAERLTATADSPRTVVSNLASPVASLALVTPRTSFPESSPTDTSLSLVSTSPGAEQWYTPATSIRTKLFLPTESGTPAQKQDCEQSDSPDDAVYKDNNSNAIESGGETKSEDFIDSPAQTESQSNITPQLLSEEQELTALTLSEKPWRLSPGVETSPLQELEISVGPSAQSQARLEETTPQKICKVTELEEPGDERSISNGPNVVSTAPANGSPSDHAALASALEDKKTELESWIGTPKATLSDSPESAPTNLSLAPSTALSHLPSPEGNFESPELTIDRATPFTESSIEPMSSRKLSFSDTDEASDASSCYDSDTDIEDTITRIENAFTAGNAVQDCDEDDACSDLASPYSLQQYMNEDSEATIVQPDIKAVVTSEDETTSSGVTTRSGGEIAAMCDEVDMASQVNVQDSSDASVSEAFDADFVAPTPEALNETNGNDHTDAQIATHDTALTEPTITLGLPAEAFSEPGSATMRTPIAPATIARFTDTDMEDEEEEEHTLLFENGNESDGSELSMNTRETMSKMVEDYLSIHGTVSPQNGLGAFYAEDQILMSPDWESHVAFGDANVIKPSKIVEDGPCLSEHADTEELTITCVAERSIPECGNDRGGGKLGFSDEREQSNRTRDAMTPLVYSQKDSFSSEITPDGLNFIKKQLVLPSPFMFMDSTVGSSVSTGPGVEKDEDLKAVEQNENEERQGIVAVPAREGHPTSEFTVVPSLHEATAGMTDIEMMRVMRETLETCRILRDEIARKREQPQACSWQQDENRPRKWIELGFFGLVVVFVTLVLVERRIQRGMFLDVLV